MIDVCGSMMETAGMSGAGWLPAMLAAAVLTLSLAAVMAGVMLRRPASSTPVGSNALAIAKERYARGEIDHDELNRLLDTLLRREDDGGPGWRR